MISAIFFDLDGCLAPAGEPGPALLAPVFQAVARANDGSLDAATLEQAFDAAWRLPFDEVAHRFGFTAAMREAGARAYAGVEVSTPMHGYGDLEVLSRLSARLFLVTTGFRRLQQSKVAALGIARHFEAIEIDAIDEPGRRGKAGIFAHLLDTRKLVPAATLVVGDNPDAEIAAGNRLGMPTVQTLRPGVQQSPLARHVIDTLWQLPGLLHSIAADAQGE